MDIYRTYLALLQDITANLDKLSALARQKTVVVTKDDLAGLDAILKQEQAISLALRGLEAKRLQQASQLGLDGVRLSQLSEHFPPEFELDARKIANALLQQYKLYEAAAHVARNTLECNLHEIEKMIEQLGGDSQAEIGYQLPDIQPPSSMKTDFRA